MSCSWPVVLFDGGDVPANYTQTHTEPAPAETRPIISDCVTRVAARRAAAAQ